MQERRKYFRLKEDDKISYSEIPNPKSERMLSLDFSLGGIRFIADHFIKPKSTLRIEIVFERAKKVINAMATVKWIKSVYEDERYEVGVEFLDIDKEDLRFLSQYLSQKIKSQ